MNDHLTDEQIAAEVADLGLDADGRRHLESCLACRAAVNQMRRLIEARRRQLAAEEPDWQAQRRAVVAGLDSAASGRRRRWRVPALAAAAAVILAAGVALLLPSGPGGSGRTIAVEEVLAETETLLDDDSIPGFEVIDPGVDELEGYLSNEAVNGGAS